MIESSPRFSPLEVWVQKVLRVPPRPQPPEGSPESIEVFHAGRNYYKLCLLLWFLIHSVILAGLGGAFWLVSKSFPGLPPWGQTLWEIAAGLLILLFPASSLFSFLSLRLNYELRWYIVTDRSLRIRSGLVSMEELTMTFSNIQEIRVKAGPLQNFLKLADVEVQSAGGGQKDGHGGHVGRFHSVSNANAIRDLMVDRLRKYRDSGLGEPEPVVQGRPNPAVDAARAVLAETRALREFLVPSRYDRTE